MSVVLRFLLSPYRVTGTGSKSRTNYTSVSFLQLTQAGDLLLISSYIIAPKLLSPYLEYLSLLIVEHRQGHL
jgi:hypothetical protein